MATRIQLQAKKIIDEAKLYFGEDSVEKSKNREDWLYRITCPDRYRVQLHRSPSDENWEATVMRELRNHGWERYKEKYEKREEESRLATKAREQMLAQSMIDRAQERVNNNPALTRAAGPLVAQPVDVEWLFAPHEYPETRRVLITPELAKVILESYNTANRPIRKGRVAFWASVIKLNRWRYTHQGAAFSTVKIDGEFIAQLQDGQHRLAAAVQEDYTLDINMSVGMDPENFNVIDVGTARSGADTVAMLGKTNVNVHSGAVRMVHLYEKYGPETRYAIKSRITNDVWAEATVTFGEAMDNAVREAWQIHAHKDSPKMSVISLAAAIYSIRKGNRRDDPRVDEFLRGYTEGTDLPQGDIRVTLRSWMSNLKSSTNRRVPVFEQFVVFIKAWNLWAQGKTLTTLGFRRTEATPKIFLPPPLEEQENTIEDKLLSDIIS